MSNYAPSAAVAISDPIVKRSDKPAVPPQRSLMHRSESLQPLLDTGPRDVAGRPADQQKRFADLIAGRKPTFVHQTDAAEELCARGASGRLPGLARIEGELTGGHVAI